MTDCRCTSHNGFLTERGFAELAQRTSLEGLLPLGGVDTDEVVPYLDKVGSVSALVEVEEFHVWDAQLLDSQHRRFLNGS